MLALIRYLFVCVCCFSSAGVGANHIDSNRNGENCSSSRWFAQMNFSCEKYWMNLLRASVQWARVNVCTATCPQCQLILSHSLECSHVIFKYFSHSLRWLSTECGSSESICSTTHPQSGPPPHPIDENKSTYCVWQWFYRNCHIDRVPKLVAAIHNIILILSALAKVKSLLGESKTKKCTNPENFVCL